MCLLTGTSLTIVLALNYLIVNSWDLAPSCIHMMCKLTDQILIPVIFKKIAQVTFSSLCSGSMETDASQSHTGKRVSWYSTKYK